MNAALGGMEGMMSDVIEALREGDVYRWRYRDPKADGHPYGSYHCCSCIAIVQRGTLKDTFWQIGGSFSDGRSFALEDLHKLELTLLGNLSHLVLAKEYEADYYDDADIVDLNHSNSTRGNFYLRNGAKRSRGKMEAVARQRLAEAESDLHTAQRRMDEINQIIARMMAGEMVSYIPSWR
jgi:hypothetical protein